MPVNGDAADLLVVASAESTVAGLLEAMAEHGVCADVVAGLADARASFLRHGGQSVLVLAPDVTPALALEITDSLRAVDPELRVVVFGDALLRQWSGRSVTRLPSYHPGSRAGAGALLKVVRAP